MKYAIVIPDGCADEPLELLKNRTPLQAANIPHMDEIVAQGLTGQASNVPAHLTAGSAVANMSLLGYDPVQHFSGRAPMEAAAQGIELGPNDWAIRCNLVTIQDQIMNDFTADHISDDEAKALLATLQADLTDNRFEFVPGVSYRNLLLYRGDDEDSPFAADLDCKPPHDLTDKTVADSFPRGKGSQILCDLMERSSALFSDHPVNKQRVDKGKLPATNVWLWGIGKTPLLKPFAEVYGKQGKMITAVDLLRGIAALIGWPRIEVPGATGYTDTDYAGKGAAAIEALDSTDIICVHIEAPDEASHEGDAAAKIKALEEIDRHIVGPLHQALKAQGDYRILVSPDHPTPIHLKTHSHGFVPFAIAGNSVNQDEQTTYDEMAANASGLSFAEGWKLMNFFLN